MTYFELKHVAVDKGKQIATTATTSSIPAFKEVLDGRWRAEIRGIYKPDADMDWLIKEILKIIPTLSDITTQRAMYYMLRGKYPNRKFRGNDLGSDKFYSQLVNDGMEKTQLATNLTMQSMGIWAAPRGYIAGDGRIYSTRRGNIPLTAQPTLQFDLVDIGARLDSHARKIIHFEKDAGFASLVSGDMPKFIESLFSTSQGQLSEAANKFLHDSEARGLKCYCVHDADTFGLQMQLLYGLASKNNAYMSSEFYPSSVQSLGFFPSIANALKLPPETVDEKDEKLFDNLNQMAKERPELIPEVKTLTSQMKKWEFQALNAMDEKAPQIYLVEGLRIKCDEIKHVPEGTQIKEVVMDELDIQASDMISNAVHRATNAALETIRQEIEGKIRDALTPQIEDFNERVNTLKLALMDVDASTYREAVKSVLVQDPSLYWDSATGRVARDSFKLQFEATADVEVVAEVKEVKAEIVADATPPDVPDTELNKDDLISAIEKRVMRQAPSRNKIVDAIRGAFEKIFGQPDLTW